MQNKAVKYTFQGMNRDLSEGKHPTEFFYEANNIRFLTTDDVITGGISFEKGNELKVTLPNIEIKNNLSNIITSTGQVIKYKYGNEIDQQINDGLLNTVSGEQTIIGHSATRNSIILFSTDDQGMDAIWKVNMDTYDIKLLYLRNIGFSKEHPIQAVYNYENENIQKVYWVDSVNQIRFLNIEHSIENGYKEDLININSNTINFVGTFNVVQPRITSIVPGGNHTAGMIQYTYNLYRLNSSQTKLAPFSELVSLDKGSGLGGGEVNEVVGSSPIVEITDLDPEYTHIKVYAVKYTSYNQLPSISLIADEEISSNRSISVFDDGNIKEELSLEQLLFLGSDPIIPAHIETKDNIMFSANIKEQIFDVDIDTRAYSFPLYSNETKVYDNIKLKNSRVTGDANIINSNSFNLVEKHDAVNINYDDVRYQPNSNIQGGEGKYIKYEIIQDDTINDPENYKFYKDNELYRFGIQFYNRLGQTSLPKWIGDFKMPEGNLEGKYNTLKVTLKVEFYIWLNTSSNFKSEDDKPVGYKVVRANRTLNDKTIITQGFLNGMMSNYRTEEKSKEFSLEARNKAEQGNKLPSLQRPFGKHHTQMEGARHFLKLDTEKGNPDTKEVHKAWSDVNWVAETFQYNVLMQMFSPEVLFENVPLYQGLKLRVKGAIKNSGTQFWGQIRRISTKEVLREGKVLNGLTPHEDIFFDNTQELNVSGGSVNAMADYGLFGPESNEGEENMDFYQFHRDFTGEYFKGSNKKYGVYGSPVLTEKGQGKTSYNNDSNFSYYNTLEPMLVDGGHHSKENSPAITSVNSWGARCLTMVLGPDKKEYAPEDRPTLERLWRDTGITESNVMLIAELVKNDQQIYLGNIYGGNSFEDKKKTKYIPIGDYKPIGTVSSVIKNGGDTFVQEFKITKISKTNTEVYSNASQQITEIVSTRIESSIDLKNRNDISLSSWDNKFQPPYDDYHKYNRVYSQQPTIMQETELDYNFRRIKNFDTRIMASKIKIPGEYIDSWTDILVNEMQDLNGKHGKINALVSFKDNIYAFQDNAFALIGINPRVQVQGGDGLAIELGTGGILHDYNYVSTTSGSINKWGVIATSNGIYYLDALNKSFLRFTGQNLEGLSSTRGLHKYLVDNLDIKTIRDDNPVINKGISLGYDLLNNDVYLTHNNNDKVWTLCFNEKISQFTGFYDYHAPIYIYTREKLLTINPNSKNEIYETHAGEYNIFYGENKLSNIIFIANPETDHECIFNNLEYKSVALDKDKQEQRYTWEYIRIYNEFQDSELRALDPNSNIRKLNRKYRLTIPRNNNSTDRIRNNWAFIELRSLNAQKLFYVNQDIILHYRPNYVSIQ